MKTRIYAPLLLSVGLAFVSATADARTSHIAIKKYATDAAKRSKSHARKPLSQREQSNRSKLSGYKTRPSQAPYLDTEIDAQEEKLYTRISTTLYPLASSRLRHTTAHRLDRLSQPIPRIETARIQSILSSPLSQKSSYLESRKSIEVSGLTGTYGVIETDLADAAHKAGLSDELLEELTHVFAWDIDFESNLHVGDQFTVLYKSTPDAGSNHIYAAQFLSRGRFLTAIRYETADGMVSYYTPEGSSLHKAFLSTPVDYARISSHFSAHRKHPVLNRIRAHKGVDYAARTGTPVKAVGDGEVTFRGRKGGYGQVIVLKHGERYETLYAHLSGFKRDLQQGDRVAQGEVIGFVGQTGLATGPHLHYEFRKDGVHQNPESLALDSPSRLDGMQLAAFKDQSKPLLDKLYQIKSRNLLVRLP